MNEVPIWEKAALTIEEASAYSSIGIMKLRELTKDSRCPFVLHVGQGKRIIKRKEFIDFISKKTRDSEKSLKLCSVYVIMAR